MCLLQGSCFQSYSIVEMTFSTLHIIQKPLGPINIRALCSMLLLCLLSVSFALENPILNEGESKELQESSEKEKKQKELIVIDQLMYSKVHVDQSIRQCKLEDCSLQLEVFPEVLTPPPERA